MVKKIIITCLSLFATLIAISGCTPNETVENDETIEVFSYEEHYNSFINDSAIGQEDGFKNTTETPISTKEQAINVAQNEVTIEYNQIEVFYDKECDMYMVVFYTEDAFGGCQSVYLNDVGLTKLIIYGEW